MTSEDLRTPTRLRSIERHRFPSHRRFVIAALRAGRRSYPVHGLLELDVTDAVTILTSRSEPLSFTAFVVAATARAAATHPRVHAYRDWRGRLVVPSHVDVATLIEVGDQGTTFPLAHLVRDADIRSVEDMSSELRAVKSDVTRSESGRLLQVADLGRIPGLASLVYRALAISPKLRQKTGTVNVTSVGMFHRGAGKGIAQPTIMTLAVLVGGRSERPRVVDGEIVARLVLDLTVSVDHAVVDGAPAARFAATLTGLIEDPSWVGNGS